MDQPVPDISVCICTFRRPEQLRRLLQTALDLETGGLFSYSIIVADNDALRSAERVTKEFAITATIPVTYCTEAQKNIARARNKAVENAHGDFIAFIDDDETPAEEWLLHLYKACLAHDVDGVLGPVKPKYECVPPDWMIKGRFFERPSYPTGYKLHWSETRTGNVLFRRAILDPRELPFGTQFDTMAEDLDFFQRMMERGHTFVWCEEAVVYEAVPASRCNRAYLLRRALLRGSNFPKHPSNHWCGAVSSLIALPCYTLALPFLALFGQDLFFSYAIKLCDHGSRLLALIGLPLMRDRSSLA